MRENHMRYCKILIIPITIIVAIALYFGHSPPRKDDPFESAIYEHDIDTAKELINNGYDANTQDEYGNTPLHFLSGYWNRKTGFDPDLIDFLISKGSDINARNKQGCTPLHIAINEYNDDMYNLLFTKNPDVNARTNDLQTPLHLAVCNPDVTEKLLALGADCHAKDKEGFTALHKACGGWANFVYLWNIEVIDILLKAGADINATNLSGNTPLHLAIHQNETIATHLVLKGAKYSIRNKNHKTPLDLARDSGKKKIADLIESGSKSELQQFHIDCRLNSAADCGFIDDVKKMIAKGADVNAKDSRGLTNLHMAVSRGNKEIVLLLLKFGADPTITDNNGLTPAQHANDYDQDIVNILNQRGKRN